MDKNAAKDKVEGKFHEVKGAVTGNKGEEFRGKAQGMKGSAEHKMDRVHEDVRDDTPSETRRP